MRPSITVAFVLLACLAGCTPPPRSEYNLAGLASGETTRDTNTLLEDVTVTLDPATGKPLTVHIGKFSNIASASAVAEQNAKIEQIRADASASIVKSAAEGVASGLAKGINPVKVP